jgi:hypothetical protein
MKKNSEKKSSFWTKPKEGLVLIKVDASFDQETHSGGRSGDQR